VQVDGVIVTVRGQRVILSPDLAAIYGVETRTLNQAVRRNRPRFPADFLIRVSATEAGQIARSRSQSVILNGGANIKHPPLGFTEHGAIMAATVLKSPRAIQMSIFVVRAFVRQRGAASVYLELRKRLDHLDRRVGGHDHDIQDIVQLVRRLLEPPSPPRRRIGFLAKTERR
jgi:hypothetical protein